MTVKSAILLRDAQKAFVKVLLNCGRMSSVNAVVQQRSYLLRHHDADTLAYRAALHILLSERSAGQFLTGVDLRQGLAAVRGAPSD